jgi:enoyl-CoA hydratase/carnithine racemase
VRPATCASRPTRRVRAGFIGIGLVPDSGGSYFIHRLLGNARAFDWMTTNNGSERPRRSRGGS